MMRGWWSDVKGKVTIDKKMFMMNGCSIDFKVMGKGQGHSQMWGVLGCFQRCLVFLLYIIIFLTYKNSFSSLIHYTAVSAPVVVLHCLTQARKLPRSRSWIPEFKKSVTNLNLHGSSNIRGGRSLSKFYLKCKISEICSNSLTANWYNRHTRHNVPKFAEKEGIGQGTKRLRTSVFEFSLTTLNMTEPRIPWRDVLFGIDNVNSMVQN